MNVLILLSFVILVFVGVLVYLGITARAGARKKDLIAARKALADIETKTQLYSDIDSVLATEIRTILRQYLDQSLEIHK